MVRQHVEHVSLVLLRVVRLSCGEKIMNIALHVTSTSSHSASTLLMSSVLGADRFPALRLLLEKVDDR